MTGPRVVRPAQGQPSRCASQRWCYLPPDEHDRGDRWHQSDPVSLAIETGGHDSHDGTERIAFDEVQVQVVQFETAAGVLGPKQVSVGFGRSMDWLSSVDIDPADALRFAAELAKAAVRADLAGAQ